jgi:hypothetical protein
MRRWLFALLGLVYAAGYLLVAIFTSGGGHGPRFTFAAAMPYGIGLLVFPVLGFLMANLRPMPIRIAYALVLLIHGAVVVGFVLRWWSEDLPYADRAWQASPMNILLPIGFYFVGQLVLWAALIRSATTRYTNRAI